MSGPSTMTRHCVLELQRILTTSCSLCDTMTKKFSVCPHSTCDVSQVELKGAHSIPVALQSNAPRATVRQCPEPKAETQ